MGFQSAQSSLDPALSRFAGRLRDEIGATRVLLFGSRARGSGGKDSDYDLIVVSDRFESVPRLKRQTGLRDLFYEVGGDAPLDLICLTSREFGRAQAGATLVSAVLVEAIDLSAGQSPSAGT